MRSGGPGQPRPRRGRIAHARSRPSPHPLDPSLSAADAWGPTPKSSPPDGQFERAAQEGPFTTPSSKGTLAVPENIGERMGGVATDEGQPAGVPVNRSSDCAALLPKGSMGTDKRRPGRDHRFRGHPDARHTYITPAADLGPRTARTPPPSLVGGRESEPPRRHCPGRVPMGRGGFRDSRTWRPIVTAGGTCLHRRDADRALRLRVQTGTEMWKASLPAGAGDARGTRHRTAVRRDRRRRGGRSGGRRIIAFALPK